MAILVSLEGAAEYLREQRKQRKAMKEKELCSDKMCTNKKAGPYAKYCKKCGDHRKREGLLRHQINERRLRTGLQKAPWNKIPIPSRFENVQVVTGTIPAKLMETNIYSLDSLLTQNVTLSNQ